jgi:hypothetical protein
VSGILLAITGLLAGGCANQPGPEVTTAPRAAGLFATPEAAVQALHDLIGKGDIAAIEAMHGPGSAELVASGDPEQDREDFQVVKQMIEGAVAFDQPDPRTRIPLFGAERWPWPIPLVAVEGGWRFDTAAGREELLNRRIGRNELSTLSTLHAIIDAQAEYASEGRDGNQPAFAARFLSTEGTHDGLYWPPVDGEPLSPLGDLLARSEYARRMKGEERQPYHGYQYRILTGQGASAPGGARSYIDGQGLLTGGFAVIAWPAKYGNSGIMTFMVNHRGIVFQKDLGDATASIATAMQSFDPDQSWVPTADRLEAVASH